MRVVFVGETLASGEKLLKINDRRFLECSLHACSCARCTYGGVGDVLIGQDLLDGLLGLIKNSCGPAESKEFRFRKGQQQVSL
ncbi:hypothetical protein C770_GR4pC0277 (plasmid) [Sinorhizobium meliloti GR4]|nr:hypothetical protein C770_GR4pC0277 [Sinorhizobium meliloti GR4]